MSKWSVSNPKRRRRCHHSPGLTSAGSGAEVFILLFIKINTEPPSSPENRRTDSTSSAGVYRQLRFISGSIMAQPLAIRNVFKRVPCTSKHIYVYTGAFRRLRRRAYPCTYHPYTQTESHCRVHLLFLKRRNMIMNLA